MQLSILRTSPIVLFVLLLCVGCGGVKFESTATSQQVSPSLAPIPKDRIKVLTAFPEDGEYNVVGKCKSSSFKGRWQNEDGSYNAYNRLKDCACKNGGNAIVITNKTQQIAKSDYDNYYKKKGVPITAHQVKVELSATVIYIKPGQYY